MAFEKFESRRGRFGRQITISKSGTIGFTAGFHHHYHLDHYKAVEFFFDRDLNRIGIKLLEEPTETSFALKARPESKGAILTTKSFMDAYAIDAKRYAGRYNVQEVDDEKFGKLFVVDLNSKL